MSDDFETIPDDAGSKVVIDFEASGLGVVGSAALFAGCWRCEPIKVDFTLESYFDCGVDFASNFELDVGVTGILSEVNGLLATSGSYLDPPMGNMSSVVVSSGC